MMQNKNQFIIEQLNKILQFLGSHGGIITIEDDWDLSLYVNDYGEDDCNIELSSSSCVNGDILYDPFFRIKVEFDERHEKIIAVKPDHYWSQWLGGELQIDENDDIYDSFGNKDHVDGELEERLCSYLNTITKYRPYLNNPNTVERFGIDAYTDGRKD